MKLNLGFLALVVGLAVAAASFPSFPTSGNGNSQSVTNLPLHNKHTLKLVEVFKNLNVTSPTNLLFGANGHHENRVYVAEESGLIYTFTNKNDETEEEPVVFMDLGDKFIHSETLNLLSLAFHPEFPKVPHFFIYYTYTKPGSLYSDTILSRFRVSEEDPNKGDSASEEQLIVLTQPRGSHHGGSLFFANWDGYLYLSLGDGARFAFDHFNYAQNPNSLLGKLLRIDVNHKTGYSIPIDNPFVSGGALPEIYALGFRNPWRCTPDTLTQSILCGDMGDSHWEELNLIVSGKNYGWNLMEGPACFVDNHCKKYLFELPIFYYPHPSMNIDSNFKGTSIVGGYIYRGTEISWLTGTYIFADYSSRQIGAVINKDWTLEACQLVGSDDLESNVLGFAVDNDQEIYVLLEGNYPIMKLKSHKHHDHDCGNGIVEESEQCDYGDQPNEFWEANNCDRISCMSLPHPGEV